MENLGHVGGSQPRLDAVEACLWRGDVDGAVRLFEDWPHERVDRFIGYLAKHRQLQLLPRRGHLNWLWSRGIDHQANW